MKVAIMQPALIPPASYFRLFAASDMFVILDSVQFNRRWYTHRQKLTDRNGEKNWLTLPLKTKPRDTTLISDLEWAEGAYVKWIKESGRFPSCGLDKYYLQAAMRVVAQIVSPFRAVEILLELACKSLDLERPKVRSSDLGIDSELSGQNRIIAICKKLGTKEYVNSPGGRHLYDEEAFSRENIKLTFLPEWRGSYDSVLDRLVNEGPEDIRREIYEQI